MQADLTDKERQLEALRQEAFTVQQELEHYYGLLMQEFWRDYPRLSCSKEISLSMETMESWLEDRCAHPGKGD